MIMKPIARVAVVRNLLWASVLCLAAGLLGGCCTVTCCESSECAEVHSCASAEARVIKLVKSRVDGCPDTWIKGFAVRAGDKVKFVNCSERDATLDFTPPGFFVEGDTFILGANKSLTLTASASATAGPEIAILAPGCTHGGSTIIVSDGP